MKRLHLIRHAKSSWDNTTLPDHDRPLKGRGRKDAALMAPAIEQAGWGESALHCSTALRAVETLSLIGARMASAPRAGKLSRCAVCFSPQ